MRSSPVAEATFANANGPAPRPARALHCAFSTVAAGRALSADQGLVGKSRSRLFEPSVRSIEFMIPGTIRSKAFCSPGGRSSERFGVPPGFAATDVARTIPMPEAIRADTILVLFIVHSMAHAPAQTMRVRTIDARQKRCLEPLKGPPDTAAKLAGDGQVLRKDEPKSTDLGRAKRAMTSRDIVKGNMANPEKMLGAGEKYQARRLRARSFSMAPCRQAKIARKPTDRFAGTSISRATATG